jgi:hypothetical protein
MNRAGKISFAYVATASLLAVGTNGVIQKMDTGGLSIKG